MSKFQNNRGGVLNDDERAASARKCLQLLAEAELPFMRPNDYTFYNKHKSLAKGLRYVPSEPELQWLRDLVSRYVTH